MCVIFTDNYSFSGRRRPVDSDALVVTDLMNLKIKPTQSFRCANRDRVCIYMFIVMSDHTCMNIYVCTVFLKREKKIVMCTRSRCLFAERFGRTATPHRDF
jgi:hypothetical protein